VGCGKGQVEVEKPARPAPLPSIDRRIGSRHLQHLQPGRPASYAVPLQAGQYLHLVVEQLGVDVAATIRDAAGRLLLRVDSPNGASGPEDLFLVAGATGRYVLAVEPWDGSGAGGRFAIRVEALRPAAPQDRTRAAAASAYSRGRLDERERAAEAAVSYQEAARLWAELNDAGREAWALYRLGKLYGEDPASRREGAELLARSVDLFALAGEVLQEAVVLSDLGQMWLRLGEIDKAGGCYERAADLWKKLGDVEKQAACWNDLARVRTRQGRIHAALDLYSRAAEVWRRQKAWGSLAVTRTNLGRLYASLGQSARALDEYRTALALLERQPDPALRAVALNKLGDVLLQVAGPEAALAPLREALELRRWQRDPRGQAVTLNSIGHAQLAANRPRQALHAFETAVEIFLRLQEPGPLASVLDSLGLAHERLGQPDRARELYQQALTLATRESPHLSAEEVSLFGLARVARLEGRLDEAEHWMEKTLEVVEASRLQVWRPDLRSSFQETRQEQYAFLIDLLAEHHQREPRRRLDARAFAVAERARARSLLDLLAAARQKPRPEELRLFDGLSRRINDLHGEMLTASMPGVAQGEPGELDELLEGLRQARAAVEGPRLTRQPAPSTLSLAELQARLLDADTLFLEYFLGEERSFLWAITPKTARFVATLPGRQQIEAAARRTHDRMTESHRQTGEVAARQAAARLSRMILGPVADLLGHRRLVVVAPGALQTVPFAALPWPGSPDERPLIADHEIVSLPSASVLGALRSQLAGRKPPSGLLAVVADPILGPDDERFRTRQPFVAAAGRGPALSRLPYTGREAATILSLAGTEPVLAASGFAASRSLVQSGRLRGFRILHFATHGLYNDLHPELSALALSAYGAGGLPVDGLLRAYEVSSLDLRADLVVLSACRTAPGEEGLTGLTNGFLLAGAPRLLVSLWDVDDRATSELMTRFYTALLREKLSPAQALRQAQLSLLREERWRAPYYWAGFIFQGEWRSSR